MNKQFAVLLFCFAAFASSGQTFQVFKGDTINRRDAEGKQQGVWRKYYKTDTLASEMFFLNGRHEGSFRTFSESGKIQSEVKFRPGYMEIADVKMFYDNGSVKAKGKYINRQKDSTWTYFDEDKKLSSTEFYVKGKKEGISKVFFPDGKVAEETIFKSDKKNGPHKEYYPDGQPRMTAVNKNGEYEGPVTIMFASGKVLEQGRYVNGLREGKWIVNKEDGTLDHEEIYKRGKVTNPVPEKEEKLDEGIIKGPDEK